jgi:hypothetical protein
MMNVKQKVIIGEATKSIETSYLKMPSEKRKGLADYLCPSEGIRDKVYTYKDNRPAVDVAIDLLQLPSLVAQKACEIHIDREETKPKTYRF